MLLLGSFGDGSLYVSFIIERGTWRLACVVMIDVVVELEDADDADCHSLFHPLLVLSYESLREHARANICPWCTIDYHQGGGIFVQSGASVLCYGCTFSSNSASSSDDLYLFTGSFFTSTECNAGWSGSWIGSVIDSNSGTYYSYVSGCTECGPGTYSLPGSSSCETECPAGAYQSGGQGCTECDAGKYSLPGAGDCFFVSYF
jgi:hypothetical protein